MTWVDLAVLGVLALSALVAFLRGLVREVLGLAAWIGAIFAGVWALPRVRPKFQEWLGASPWIDPIAFGVVEENPFAPIQSDGVPVVGWQKATALALDNFVCLGHGK